MVIESPIFFPFWSFSNSWLDYFLFALISLLLFLTITLQTQKRTVTGYSPRLAWIRGGIYFTSGFILSILTGVMPALISKPIATEAQVSNFYWWLFTFVCVDVVKNDILIGKFFNLSVLKENEKRFQSFRIGFNCIFAVPF